MNIPFSGYRTYIIGIASLAFAAFGYSMGFIDGVAAMQIAQVSLASMGIRAAVK